MDTYMVKPLLVEKAADGKYYATATIKNAEWWKSFETEVNGEFKKVTTVSSDRAKDMRVVKFQVPSAQSTIKTRVHIKIPMINYDNHYMNYLKIGGEVKKIARVSSAVKSSKKYFVVQKEHGKAISMMDQYVMKPASIQKVGSKTYAKIILKNGNWWKQFKVKQGSRYVDAKVVAKTKKTKTVMFPVANLKKTTYVKIHVVIPNLNYNNHYKTKIIFK